MFVTLNVQSVFMGWMFGDVGYTQSPSCVCGLDVWRCLSQSKSSLCLWVGCLEMLDTVNVQPVFVGWMFVTLKVQPMFVGWMFGDVIHTQSPACVCGLDVWRC